MKGSLTNVSPFFFFFDSKFRLVFNQPKKMKYNRDDKQQSTGATKYILSESLVALLEGRPVRIMCPQKQ